MNNLINIFFFFCSVGLPGSVFSDYLPLLANLSPSIEQYTSFMEVMWYQVMNGLGQLLVRSNIQRIISDVNEAASEMIQKINEDGYGTEIARYKFSKYRQINK